MTSENSPSDATDTKFHYSAAPLEFSNHEIRLVELQRNELSDKPDCVLRSYPVGGPYPPYIALSYIWGPDIRYNDITLNGRPFAVGRNLWHFLERMRSNEQFGTFWIDAISIDQSNVRERNHQVQMMRQIYSNARSVFAWLGEEDPITHSNAALDYLTRREAFQADNEKLDRFWTTRQAKAVLALCERPYWTRIWIVQELLLAREVTIYCGSKSMSWHHLNGFFDDVASIVLSWGQHIRIFPVLASPASSIIKAKKNWTGEQAQPLLTLLKVCRNQRSTDVRDKIYALYGLASDTDALGVDYGITAEQLLVLVMKHTCTALGSSVSIRTSRKTLLRTGELLRDVLKVHYDDHQLDAVINAEAEHLSIREEELADWMTAEEARTLREKTAAEERHKKEERRRSRRATSDRLRYITEAEASANPLNQHVRTDARNARTAVMRKARRERPWSTRRPRHADGNEEHTSGYGSSGGGQAL